MRVVLARSLCRLAPMKSRPALLLALIATLASVLALAGCGDDDDSSGAGSDTDPQAVLDAALGGDQPIDSGVLELSFDLEATGSQPGTLSASLSGPFQSGGDDGALPQLDFTASANVDAAETQLDFEGGLTLVSDGAYISYGGTDYQVDDPTFSLLQQSYEESAQLQESEGQTGSLQAFGIDPATWVTDLINEGTEDLDGTEVVHVSGAADVGAVVDDLTAVAEQTGQADQVGAASLEQIESAVTSATIDVYANAEDDTLRKLDLSVDIDDPAGDGTITILLSIGIADTNEEQEITAPEDAEPLAGLLEQIPGGAGALGGLGAIGGSTGIAPEAGAVAPSTDPGSTGLSPSADSASEYYDCAASAQTESDLQACAELLAP